MTRPLIIILTIFLAACGQESQSIGTSPTESKTSAKDSLEIFTIKEVTADDFDSAIKKYANKTLYDTTTFSKVNGEIKLPVDQKLNPFVIFKDTLVDSDNSDVRQYFYEGQFDKIGLYIVNGVFWEASEYYLINKKTGIQTAIWNAPLISKNDKYIANISMSYGLEGDPNGLQVWRVDKDISNQTDTISKYIELDQLDWVPHELVWDSDSSLIVKVVSVDKYLKNGGHKNDADFYYLRLQIK